MSGGPPRWLFDLPLSPNGNDLIKKNNMVCTKVAKNVADDSELIYESVKIGNYYLPPVWKTKVRIHQGNLVELSDLTQNMIMIRGCNMGIDGHEVNRARHNAPTPGSPSLSGIVADYSRSPLAAVYSGLEYGYKSKKGIANISIMTDASNSFSSSLFSAFQVSSLQSVRGRENMVEAMNNFIKFLGRELNVEDKYFKSLLKDRENSIKLFKLNFDGISDVFDSLQEKYVRVVNEAVIATIQEGVNDKPFLAIPKDLRYSIAANATLWIPGTEFDFRDTLNEKSNIPTLCGNLAACEFLFKNNLSSSFTMQCGGLSMVSIDNCIGLDGNVLRKIPNCTIETDPHVMGSLAHYFYFSTFYRGLGAGILEFTEALKNSSINGENLFDKTVIHIAGEFSRSPRKNETGSDHGWQAANTSIISGQIEQLEVIGNISTEGFGEIYPGTWGVGAPCPEIGNRVLTVGNLVSSVATLLDIESPSPNDQSVISKQNGVIRNEFGRPENIEGYIMPS